MHFFLCLVEPRAVTRARSQNNTLSKSRNEAQFLDFQPSVPPILAPTLIDKDQISLSPPLICFHSWSWLMECKGRGVAFSPFFFWIFQSASFRVVVICYGFVRKSRVEKVGVQSKTFENWPNYLNLYLRWVYISWETKILSYHIFYTVKSRTIFRYLVIWKIEDFIITGLPTTHCVSPHQVGDPQ